VGKIAVIGLDGAAPSLVFDRWRQQLPNLSALMERGAWGELRSVHPPITVPAWAVVFSGKDPGQLGIYGLRNRRAHDYSSQAFAHSGLLPDDMLWDTFSRQGKKVILLGVPPGYPPRPVNGCAVSCFLTPSSERPYTYPQSLRAEVEAVSGGYVHDVDNFRTGDKQDLLRRIYEKTRKHFAVARHLLATREWDLFAMVEMGLDRLQHGFWAYFDAAHPDYVADNPYESAVLDYYRYLDAEIGELLELIPEEARLLVLSDHGARALHGSLCFNEWLIRMGYLVLKDSPRRPAPLAPERIDWRRTRAWGEGGYYGRLFLNVRGREPEGVVEPGDVERLRGELVAAVAEIEAPGGGRLGCQALRPQDIYRETNGVPPDLMVYFGDLDWRAAGSVGNGCLHEHGTDIGPDQANHDWKGICIVRDRKTDSVGQLEGLRLTDIAATYIAT